MLPRPLTQGEKAILRPIYGTTIPYDDIWVSKNTMLWGGPNNSITLASVPNFAVTVYRPDFTVASDDDKATFVHEIAHVWQYYHGNSNQWSGIKLWWKYDDYEDAYPYSLDEHQHLRDFNMEQQASIIEDYWLLTQNKTPTRNKGMRARLSDYEPYIAEVKASGPPLDRSAYARRPDSRPL